VRDPSVATRMRDRTYEREHSEAAYALGLAMVYGIVKQHREYIACYSEPDVGTTFRIYFPALISESEAEEALVQPVPRGGSETILLVDDEVLIRDLGGRIMTRAGYRVLTAVNGKDALQVYTTGRQDISLVILDLIMPEMGGKQCLEEVLKIDPQARVLIASGYSVTGSSNEALAAGAKGFVNKPYDMRELLATVRAVLDEES
jgi:two-component system, cell cycle sensor histidine kinase and response regulator CckA